MKKPPECEFCSFKKKCPFVITVTMKREETQELKQESVCAILYLVRRMAVLEDKIVKNQAAIESDRNNTVKSLSAVAKLIGAQIEQTKELLSIRSIHSEDTGPGEVGHSDLLAQRLGHESGQSIDSDSG